MQQIACTAFHRGSASALWSRGVFPPTVAQAAVFLYAQLAPAASGRRACALVTAVAMGEIQTSTQPFNHRFCHRPVEANAWLELSDASHAAARLLLTAPSKTSKEVRAVRFVFLLRLLRYSALNCIGVLRCHCTAIDARDPRCVCSRWRQGRGEFHPHRCAVSLASCACNPPRIVRPCGRFSGAHEGRLSCWGESRFDVDVTYEEIIHLVSELQDSAAAPTTVVAEKEVEEAIKNIGLLCRYAPGTTVMVLQECTSYDREIFSNFSSLSAGAPIPAIRLRRLCA